MFHHLRPWRFFACLAVLSLAACNASPLPAAAPGGLFPFVLPWDDSRPSVANLSSWNVVPAGKDGPVMVRAGHLFEGGRRIRFFGVNVTFSACFPSHADAEKIAARLAKFGINAVRFHHMDTEPAPNGLLKSDGRSFDPGQLDRLDYFVAQLSKNGIYVDLNLHVGRTYPGMPRWNGMPRYFKGVDLFYPPMIRMQQEYARDLLTHLNPYTGSRYAQEPAVAFVELANEDGLLYEWWRGALDSMPGVYADELTQQWRSWLSRRYPTTEAFRQAWGMADQPRGAEMLAPLGSASAWTLQTSQGAKASDIIESSGRDGLAPRVIQVLAPGGEPWSVQMYQVGLAVRADRVYTLAFRARADAPCAVQVNLMQAHEPWRLLWSSTVSLTQDWKQYRFTFMPSGSDVNARVTFGNLGASRGTYRLSQAFLTPGGIIGLPAGKGIESIGIFRTSDFAGEGLPARRDWVRFLWEEEEQYWTGMARYLREDLHVQAPLIGTQADFSPAPIQAELDVVDNHASWQHPVFPRRPWDPVDWFVKDIPMAGAIDGGEISRLALQRMAGKPYIVSEYNHPAPNTFSSEAFILLSAYAAMQDWDGVFAFDYGDTRSDWNSRRIVTWYPIDQDPAKMVTLPAAAALFRRGDVTALPLSGLAAFTSDAAIDRVMEKGPALAADAFGIGRADALSQSVGMTMSDSAAPASSAPPPLPGSFATANGELRWDSNGGKGLVTINTPRSKAVVGYILRRTFDLGGIVIAPGTTIQDWAAITLTAMDSAASQDLLAPGRILVTTTGFTQNTGMGWKNADRSTVGRDWGRTPTLLESIPVAITLPVASHRLEAFALDERGQRGERLPVTGAGGKTTVELGAGTAAPWYELVIH